MNIFYIDSLLEHINCGGKWKMLKKIFLYYSGWNTNNDKLASLFKKNCLVWKQIKNKLARKQINNISWQTNTKTYNSVFL
jgi:hypothetical protein